MRGGMEQGAVSGPLVLITLREDLVEMNVTEILTRGTYRHCQFSATVK